MVKILKQSVKNIGHVRDLKGIEKIARLCYRSEDKITEDSYKKMISMLLKKGHLSVFEHINLIIYWQIDQGSIFENFFDYPFIEKTDLGMGNYIVSGSLRAFFEYLKNRNYFLFEKILYEFNLNEGFPKVVNNSSQNILNHMYFFPIDENCIIENKSGDIREYNLNETIEKHIMHTFYVVTDRGISHEYITHRWTHGKTQESTRYINLKEMEVILPIWFYNVETDKDRENYKLWLDSCESDFIVYKKLLDNGMTPQQARNNLPHSLKTSLYSTMSLKQWKHFLNMRNSKNAHPMMEELADMINRELIKEYPGVFKSLKNN